ncbi:hypothetical protein DFR60_115122 [Hungatella effluvii]|uniref:Uncharacterized protein n=1 Tax=Hungatella effluvii TaxID=1096246 RepID=A0A2V3Y1G0_9FIRM|nr:hypothetical protein DFR60_115122 [Hungatella effluvii]
MYEIKGPLLVIAILSIFGSYKKRSIIYILCLIYFNNSYLLAFITGIIISDFSVNCHFIKKKFYTKIISTIVFFTGIILSMYPVIINNFTGIYHIMQKISDDKTLFWRLIGSSMIFFGIININWFIFKYVLHFFNGIFFLPNFSQHINFNFLYYYICSCKVYS